MGVKSETYDNLDFSNLNSIITSQCAPVFSGLKLSNLLVIDDIYSQECECSMTESFDDLDISYVKLLSYKSKSYYLVYKCNNLPAYINCRECRHLLNELGYEKTDFVSVIKQLKKRYTLYMYNNEHYKYFPHEIGLVLGYPVEDVRGFIDNSGENYIYNGYWKVYGHPNEKHRLFCRYERATKMMLKRIADGTSMREVICDNRLFHKAV